MSIFSNYNLHVVVHKKEQSTVPVKRRLFRVRLVIWSGWLLIILFFAVAIFSYLTNPFVKFSLVKDEIVVQSVEGELVVIDSSSPIVRNNRFWRAISFAKSGYYMASTLFKGGKVATGRTVDEIITQIHVQRFSDDLPFLISGDHFSMLYPRSLGIFYHSLLDPRTVLDAVDWKNRQTIYLKTLTFALAVYANTDHLSTTIMPIGGEAVVLINVYAPPSDTLYSMLYALRILQNPTELETTYPFEANDTYVVNGKVAAQALLDQYRTSLQRHYQNYWNTVYDPVTGLSRRDVVLSGTKDSVIRHGAFYDNVMLWKTNLLAQQLQLIPTDEEFTKSFKQRIINAFWNEQDGFFIEELGKEGHPLNAYSSDWLIAYQTGMLHPSNEKDILYLQRSIEYIQSQRIDQPFGLRFTNSTDVSNYYWLVRIGTPEYVTEGIWSHWGMEYTKLLAHMAKVTQNVAYAQKAQYQIDVYSANIIRNQGFPELYSSDGAMYSKGLYNGVRATGWVVNFEEARAMTKEIVEELTQGK